MALTPRDVSVVRFLARFGQATASQIRDARFGGVNRTIASNSLQKLLSSGHIMRIGRYSLDDTGGSPPFVYMLGRRGREYVEADTPKARRPLPHALHLCQAYVDFKLAEQRGELKVLKYAVEKPVVHGTRDDLSLEIGVPQGLAMSFYIEIDMDTMGKARIIKKLEGYASAGHNAPVVFGVIDEPRAKTINRYIREQGYDPDVFHACQFKEVVPLCLSLFEPWLT